MEAVIVVLVLALLALAGALIWLLLQQRRPAQEPEGQRLEQQLVAMKGDLAQAVVASQQTVLQQVNNVDAKLNQRLDAVQGNIARSLTSQHDTIRSVGERLGELSQTTHQMLQIGQDISSLQDILRPPKLRGGFGEMLLERLLAQILPDEHYGIQHRFGNGVQVDAVIRLGNGLVPVDSKFPLEAFHRMLKAESDEERASLRKEFVRAVRGHIDAVAKYILPDEGTFPFALMYIPAENVYYEVIVKDDLLDAQANLSTYALERRVIPASPNSFYAYLQAIVLGLKGMRVEERA
ncbi:MAG: DNA recombination protein RmuC, partial [Dehalococcoidia bacterium]|nr:DNA recombination protein RmuC [Dehalococcoidia bacterium]